MRTALLIDDDPDLRKIVAKIISTDGLTVIQAPTVSAAIELIQKTPPDIIFTDLNLEPESGFDFIVKYKEMAKGDMAPVIVLSAQADREAIQKAFSLGAKEYLVKPVKAQLLLQKMRKLLKEKKFLSVEFTEAEQPTVVCRLPASVVAACEVGFKVEAPARFAKDSSVLLESSISKELGVEQLPKLQTSSKLAKSTAPGQFLTELKFVGISQEKSRKMRDLLKRWA